MTELRSYKASALRGTTAGTEGGALVGLPAIDGLTAQANNVEQAIRELAASSAPPPAASETEAGIAEIATQDETNTGADDLRIVTPSKLAGRTATEERTGLVKRATQAEVEAGTSGNLVATVARLKNELDRRQTQEEFIAPSLTSGWVNVGGAHEPVGYYKDTLGRVHLKGAVSGGTVGSAETIFTLPTGYRPGATNAFSPTTAGTGTARVDVVESDGRVIPRSGNNTFLSLAGISFRAA